MTQWDRLIEPTQEDLIRAHIEHALFRVHTAMPCRVQSYDATLQVCDLVPLVRHAIHDPDGGITHEDYPVLPCVPVVFPRTQDHFIAFAIQPGDMGLAVFCEDAIGHWRVGGGDVTDPGFLGRHHLGSGVFIPGLFDRSRKLAHAPAFTTTPGSPRLVIGDDADEGTRVTFGSDGSVKVTRGSTVRLQIDADGTVHIGGATASQFVALANLVDARLSALKAILTGWTVTPGDGGAALKTAMSAWDVSSVAATKAKAT